MRVHNVPLFITHFFIKNSGRVLEKSFAPPLSRLIKKGKTQHCVGASFFLVCGLNAAFFRTPDLAMVSNGKKTEQPIFFATA